MNDQWAQDLIQEVPIKMVATRIVSVAFNTTTNIIDKYALASKKFLKPTLGPDRDQCAKIVPKKA